MIKGLLWDFRRAMSLCSRALVHSNEKVITWHVDVFHTKTSLCSSKWSRKVWALIMGMYLHVDHYCCCYTLFETVLGTTSTSKSSLEQWFMNWLFGLRSSFKNTIEKDFLRDNF